MQPAIWNLNLLIKTAIGPANLRISVELDPRIRESPRGHFSQWNGCLLADRTNDERNASPRTTYCTPQSNRCSHSTGVNWNMASAIFASDVKRSQLRQYQPVTQYTLIKIHTLLIHLSHVILTTIEMLMVDIYEILHRITLLNIFFHLI